jgi:hypothetical protein
VYHKSYLVCPGIEHVPSSEEAKCCVIDPGIEHFPSSGETKCCIIDPGEVYNFLRSYFC